MDVFGSLNPLMKKIKQVKPTADIPRGIIRKTSLNNNGGGAKDSDIIVNEPMPINATPIVQTSKKHMMNILKPRLLCVRFTFITSHIFYLYVRLLNIRMSATTDIPPPIPIPRPSDIGSKPPPVAVVAVVVVVVSVTGSYSPTVKT